MTAISSWKGMAEMPKFKSSAPRGYGLWMSHYFWGEEAGVQHILSVAKRALPVCQNQLVYLFALVVS